LPDIDTASIAEFSASGHREDIIDMALARLHADGHHRDMAVYRMKGLRASPKLYGFRREYPGELSECRDCRGGSVRYRPYADCAPTQQRSMPRLPGEIRRS
jgi:hypothetical protein